MATKYQHVLDSIRKDVAKQVGGLLWDLKVNLDEGEDGDDNGTAGGLVPA